MPLPKSTMPEHSAISLQNFMPGVRCLRVMGWHWLSTAALVGLGGCGTDTSRDLTYGAGSGTEITSSTGSGSGEASSIISSGKSASGSPSSGSPGASTSGASIGSETGSSGVIETGTDADASFQAAPDADTTARADASLGHDASTPDAPVLGNDASTPACGGSSFGTGPTATTTTHLDIGVHDPSMIWDGQKYYLFNTGGTLAIRTSPDLQTWTNTGNVLASMPGWITQALGSTPSDLWAPDVSYFNGQFHIYYAGSSFGSNDSAIGLSTTPTLASPHWTDQGLVFASKTTDNFNAIDPNISFDQNCTPWLSFGSFWSGIKMRKLSAATGKLATDDPILYPLASRNGGAIEAASIVSHNGYYYLFVSFDACCKGVNSTYRTMMGRAKAITGPYTNKAGVGMMQGGAEQLLGTSGRYIGPGGGTAWKNGSTYLYAFHYYDGDANGASKLQIRPIEFGTDDWVTLGDPLFP